jgi:hypothetical protein
MPVRPAPRAFLPQTSGREWRYGEHGCGMPNLIGPDNVVLSSCALRADMIVPAQARIAASLYDHLDWALTGHGRTLQCR